LVGITLLIFTLKEDENKEKEKKDKYIAGGILLGFGTVGVIILIHTFPNLFFKLLKEYKYFQEKFNTYQAEQPNFIEDYQGRLSS
jgi:hypothetical protein